MIRMTRDHIPQRTLEHKPKKKKEHLGNNIQRDRNIGSHKNWIRTGQ
jgi:hypothetical protein